MTRKGLIDRHSKRASRGIVLGAGLEPASLSAYAPQTYVSTSSTTRASRGRKLSAGGNDWQVSSVFLFVLPVLFTIALIMVGRRADRIQHRGVPTFCDRDNEIAMISD